MFATPLTCKYCLKSQYFNNAEAREWTKIMSNIFKAQIEDPNITIHRKNMQIVLNSTQKH